MPPTARFLVNRPGCTPASILYMVARGVDAGNPLFGDIFNKLWMKSIYPQYIGFIAQGCAVSDQTGQGLRRAAITDIYL
jgi:hypothetical protein